MQPTAEQQVKAEVESIWRHYLDLTGDASAAGALTHAHATLLHRHAPPPIDPSLSVDEAAKIVGVSADTIRVACKQGRIVHSRYGKGGRGVIRIRRTDLDEYMKRSSVTPGGALDDDLERHRAFAKEARRVARL